MTALDLLEDSLESVPVGFGRVVPPSDTPRYNQREDYEIGGKFHGTTAAVDVEKPMVVNVSNVCL